MTKAQKENRERFKKVQAEAKKLRKKNPKLTHIESVKQAWAIDYSKKKKPSKKVAEIGKVKKSAPKKKAALKKKVASKKKGISEQSILNKIHKVKHDVEKLDESQHKHMISGVIHIDSLNKAIKRKEMLENIYKKTKKIPLKERSETNKVLLKELPTLIKGEKSLISMFKKMIK